MLLSSTYKRHDDTPSRGGGWTDTTSSNHSINVNGTNMYDLWVMK